ncbi:sodium:solute symporter [Jiulongibacter sediminis]|jgi:SSS family solute:Na+ symporter|uniref:sodium:solute symporter n=1 Tax=Jiulongibacter sediminis TaxID=1605367 RepID=UPI0026F32E30|nr:sodium:solute symporter [Jiulongibacter sediminis]
MADQLDFAVILIYLLAVLAFGYSFYRKNKTAGSFTRGDGQFPAWALGMSVFATYVSSISFLALPGNAFAGDWSSFVFSLSIPLAAVIAVRFFVPFYRKINRESAYTFLEERFGRWARTYAAFCYLLTQLARMGAILYLLSLPVHSLTGWSVSAIIVITGLMVMVYASIGGIKAVVYTDAIQGFILISGALLCFVLLLSQIEGGLSGFLSMGLDSGKMSLGQFQFSFSDSSFWLILLYGFFINLQNFGADQSYIQRYIGAKTDEGARRSVWMGALLYIPVSLLFFMIGTALWIYYRQNSGLLPPDLQADQILPFYIVNELPSGIKGLLIAAILSAGMSTVSTSVNSSATVLLEDFYKRSRKVSDQNALRFLRLTSGIMALLSIVVGLMFMGVNSALDIWWALASIFSGGILGLILLGQFSGKTTNKAAQLAVAGGLIFILYSSLNSLFPDLKVTFGLHPNFVIIISTLLILGIGLLLSKTNPKR